MKTQGRTLDCPFNFLPPRVAGWLLMCPLPSVQLGCGGFGGHGSAPSWRFKYHVESGLSVVVEWRHHSNQAGTPRRATNPQSGEAPSQETAPTTRCNGRWATSSLVDVPVGVECWALRILVDVPAVLCEHWAQRFDTRGGTSPGQPTRELVGRETVACVRYPRGLF